MKSILIDLTQIPRQKTGVGIYAINLVRHISEIDRKNHYTILIQDDEDSFETIQKDNVRFIKIYSKIFRILPFRFFFEQVILPFILILKKVDAIHSLHYSFPLVTFGTTRVVTIHDLTFMKFPYMHTFLKRYYFKAFTCLAAKKADRVICISHSTQKDLIHLTGIHRNRIHAINIATSIKNSLLKSKKDINDIKIKFGIQDKYLLFVGMIEPRKNIDKLLLAFDQVHNKYKEYQLVITGPKGWRYGSIFRLINTLESKEKVLFTGYVNDHEKAVLMKHAKLFVYPSLYEGFGLPVLEAMSLGIPTITSNVSSMPEIAGDAAILIDPENSDELYQSIKRLLDDNELYSDLKEKSILQSNQFSWGKTAQKTIDVYEDVLNN